MSAAPPPPRFARSPLHDREAESVQAERCVGIDGHSTPTRMGGTANPPGCLAPWGSMVRPSFGSCPQQMIGSTSRMQGKEASEQETELKSSVGIDVSKHWLDIHVLPSNERLRVCNNCHGIRQLKRWVKRFDPTLVA